MDVVFMTGATGYIGKHVLKLLAEGENELLVLVRSQEKLNRMIAKWPEKDRLKIHAVAGDLGKPGLGLNEQDTARVLQANVIVHAGGPMNIMLDRRAARAAFLDGSREIAAIAERMQAVHGLKHFIHVVGYMSPFHEGNVDLAADPYRMDDFMSKEGEYERMKFLADLLIRQHALKHRYPLSVVNPSTVIGSARTGVTEQIGGFGLLVDAVRRGMMPSVPGGDDHWLPLVPVDETAAFIAALVREARPASDTYTLLKAKKDSPSMTETVGLIARELRVRKPIGSVPVPLLKSALRFGGSKLAGIPAESLSFITRKTFDIRSAAAFKQKYDLPQGEIRSALPAVIADLDYRISHPHAIEPDPLSWSRHGRLASLSKPGTGTPLVWIHGVMGRADQSVPLAAGIPGRPVVMLDLPGFGRSPYHHAADPLEGHIDAVVEAIASFDEPVDVAGHSLGAVIAAQAASKVPEHVRKLILLQPAFSKPVSGRIFKLLVRSPMLLDLYLNRGLTVSALRKTMLDSGAFVDESEIPQDYLESIVRDMRSPRVRRTNGELLRLLHLASGRLKSQLLDEAKTTVVWGMADRQYSLDNSVSGTSIVKVPYGHQFPISHPGETAAILLQITGTV